MTVTRNYRSQDLIIVPVRDLQVSDVVRDFYSSDPSYGVVKRLGSDHVAVLWDGDHNFKTLMFKTQHGQRTDIIQVRRP